MCGKLRSNEIRKGVHRRADSHVNDFAAGFDRVQQPTQTGPRCNRVVSKPLRSFHFCLKLRRSFRRRVIEARLAARWPGCLPTRASDEGGVAFWTALDGRYERAASAAAARRKSRSSSPGGALNKIPQDGTPVGIAREHSPIRLPTRVLRSARRFSVT